MQSNEEEKGKEERRKEKEEERRREREKEREREEGGRNAEAGNSRLLLRRAGRRQQQRNPPPMQSRFLMPRAIRKNRRSSGVGSSRAHPQIGDLGCQCLNQPISDDGSLPSSWFQARSPVTGNPVPAGCLPVERRRLMSRARWICSAGTARAEPLGSGMVTGRPPSSPDP